MRFCVMQSMWQTDVSIEEIEYLRQIRFSWTKIAEILQISRSTLYRRLEEENLSQSLSFTNISDVELDRLISSVKACHPNDGERLMTGHLARHNVFVPRARVRGSIHRVDPVNTALRTIRRRVYRSEGPNAVWHVDGNHKLIRWRFVVHGGIDGYSRSIVFLNCSNNNRSCTVLSHFRKATEEYGVPSRLRTDLGGENSGIWRYMLEQRPSLSTVITGSSTHNERLWRDVTRCVGSLFRDIFSGLEDDGTLDPLNEIDIFCLHYVFNPRINKNLASFVESWNNHPVSTERNRTPNQLFISGALETETFPQLPVASSSTSIRNPMSREHIEVPRSSFVPCRALCIGVARIDPLGLRVTSELIFTKRLLT